MKEMYYDAKDCLQIFEIGTTWLWRTKQGERQVTKYYLEMTSLRQELDLCVEEKRGMPDDNLQCKKRLENERVLIPLDD